MIQLYRGPLAVLAASVGGMLISCQTLAPQPAATLTFPNPWAAGDALASALRSGDDAALAGILGSNADALLESGDEIGDQAERERFLAQYDEAHRWSSSGAGAAVLEIGDRAWPFPVPLVRNEDGWEFDLEQGADEFLNRRIGRNELNAIQACLAFVDAEREYYQRNPAGYAVPEYARFIVSREGKKNGLYWQAGAGEPPSPLGSRFAEAREDGYSPATGGGNPFYGYFFRVLRAQGAQAPGGAYDYIVDGQMTGGFALVAWPARYGSSGVMTFLINQVGVLYEKDLGPDTDAVSRGMMDFDPDTSWRIVPADARALPDS